MVSSSFFSALVCRQLQLTWSGYSALCQHSERALRRALCWPRVTRAALATRVGTTPHRVVFRTRALSLLRYERLTPATQREPVLFCYALINRPYVLDLQPDRSVVRRYLEQGHDVYLIDWGVPSSADRGVTLEHYVCGLLDDVVRFILSEQGCKKLHLLGYCMGGTLSTLFTALNPELISTLTLLAAPIDFSGKESLLSVWTDRRYFDVDAFIDAHGNCPAWFLQLCFLYTKPVQNLLEKGIGFYEQMEDPRFLSNYFAMERWVNDNVPVAGETFREFVKKLYQENQLVRGELHLGDRRVVLGRITCPLLLLTAKRDHLVAPASTHGVRAHVGSAEIEQMSLDAGHVGLVVSSKAHATLWPRAAAWLASFSEGAPSAPSSSKRDA